MKRIFAISDGGFRPNDKRIDQACVALLKKEHPKVLLLTQALEPPYVSSASLNNYAEQFHKRYRDELGCETDVLKTVDNISPEDIREKILSADAVYVAPGHVPNMMARMHQFGIDSVLKEAYEKGILMAGLSAGAMCWFKPNLGFIDKEFHPHYPTFTSYDPDYKRVSGYVATDGIAALFLDGKIGQIVKADADAELHYFGLDETGKRTHCRVDTILEQRGNTKQ